MIFAGFVIDSSPNRALCGPVRDDLQDDGDGSGASF
jgi:hypothetical protein